MTFEN
jgi:uncharacterized membrane protein